MPPYSYSHCDLNNKTIGVLVLTQCCLSYVFVVRQKVNEKKYKDEYNKEKDRKRKREKYAEKVGHVT